MLSKLPTKKIYTYIYIRKNKWFFLYHLQKTLWTAIVKSRDPADVLVASSTWHCEKKP